MTVQLYLGGARSGKSGYAEQQAIELYHKRRLTEPDTRLHYVATGEPFDDGMKERIRLHQERRDGQWVNHEHPLKLTEALRQFSPHDIVFVDCLSVWLNNVIHYKGDTVDSAFLRAQIEELAETLREVECKVLCVSTEVGLGIIPMNALSRFYVDHAGWMNQAVAAVADRVVMVAAGLPMVLKGEG
ncbi:bifunctional adenosylcobinamide kinase/adenosylcobinamide-phosphate guanylyltransferase [Vibrio albus]|uniref:Bifunctional adenosylcobalamin biosynthesis protein n=1 Tax=Vibrio albus TaxID=2200953 RepID=A0A2U3B640_9VIBR|nr:bifunctional adenosylcobinamide kinase/adenosylcobinamide-phosphate guanylyltransferase [Vibrio albus]PWI32259.1 bifunctional adenosylcobinamide kinase/adenosylcobinamide-phosphate guanylyltransferase [Vibrio albus]